MVVEDTRDHHAIFGDEGERVMFFKSPLEMVEKTRLLLNDPDRRSNLRDAARAHILTGHNTYADRLRTMMDPS